MRLLVAIFTLVPAIASAEGNVSFEVADHGDSVEVIAHNVEAKSTNISSIRSRLEIPLVGNPVANRQMMGDPTVLQVELDGVSARVLSVKTRLDRSRRSPPPSRSARTCTSRSRAMQRSRYPRPRRQRPWRRSSKPRGPWRPR